MVLWKNGPLGLHAHQLRAHEVALGTVPVQSTVPRRKKSALPKAGLDGPGVPTGVDQVSPCVVGNVEVMLDCIVTTQCNQGKDFLAFQKSSVTLVRSIFSYHSYTLGQKSIFYPKITF